MSNPNNSNFRKFDDNINKDNEYNDYREYNVNKSAKNNNYNNSNYEKDTNYNYPNNSHSQSDYKSSVVNVNVNNSWSSRYNRVNMNWKHTWEEDKKLFEEHLEHAQKKTGT